MLAMQVSTVEVVFVIYPPGLVFEIHGTLRALEGSFLGVGVYVSFQKHLELEELFAYGALEGLWSVNFGDVPAQSGLCDKNLVAMWARVSRMTRPMVAGDMFRGTLIIGKFFLTNETDN